MTEGESFKTKLSHISDEITIPQRVYEIVQTKRIKVWSYVE